MMSATSSARHVEKDAPSIETLARIAFSLLDQYPVDRANARHRAVADTMKRFGLDGATTYHQILTSVFGLERATAQTGEARRTEPVRKHKAPTARWKPRMNTRSARPGFIARVHQALAAAEEAAPVIEAPSPTTEHNPPPPAPPKVESPAPEDGQFWLAL